MVSKIKRDKDGRFTTDHLPAKEIQDKYDIDIKEPMDYIVKMNEVIQRTSDLEGTKRADFGEFYTPLDDFYAVPSGSDMGADSGRIPVEHLMMLASKRLGVVWRGCNGVANDVFRNKFSFVDIDDIEKVVKRPEIRKWMLKTHYWSRITRDLDLERRSGRGHLVFYYPNEKGTSMMHMPPPKIKPHKFQVFSAQFLTPVNIGEAELLDYDKQKWKFTGGLFNVSEIHENRVHVLETREEEGSLRGLAIAEMVWVPLMCYLNTQYYLLKALAQMGIATVGINIDAPYPTKEVANAYLDLLKKFRANNFWLLGKESKLQILSSKIGSGIHEYVEFLKEDISSAWIVPLNQLFGRAQGGGLEGAGALVSKEDYLASNLSVLQLQLTDDVMDILNMVGFPDLESITLRWNLDLHKTEQQRLIEEGLRLDNHLKEIAIKKEELGLKAAKEEYEAMKAQRVKQLTTPPKPKSEGEIPEETEEEGGETPD